MFVQLITMLDAKDHLRIYNEDADFDIDSKITEASALILFHMKIKVIPADWYKGNPPVLDPPADIKAYTKLILSELYFNRESSNADLISDKLAMMIPRDPSMA